MKVYACVNVESKLTVTKNFAAITKHFIIPPHLTLNIYTLLRSDWMRANAKVRKHNSKEG